MQHPRRRGRQNSNVFNMLTKSQIMQLREAFSLLDVDRDGKLSVKDLATFLESIGSPLTQETIEEMIEELSPNCDFLMLLTCVGEKMSEIGAEHEIMGWLRFLDEDDDGFIDSDHLKQLLTDDDEAFSAADYDYLVKGCLEGGAVDCKKLASKIKHGEIINPRATETQDE